MSRHKHFPPNIKPFSSEQEYREHRLLQTRLEAECQRLSERYRALKQSDPEEAKQVMEEMRVLTRQEREARRTYNSRLPLWLHARCPFCDDPLYWKLDPFDLAGPWWAGPFVPREYKAPTCPHVLCVDGALNLEGHVPQEVSGGRPRAIHMASEVPFVKPRLLGLGNVIAVIHKLPGKIGKKYTGYPIVYFGDPRPPLSLGSLGWACTEFHNREGKWNIVYDVQDYDLDKWIEAGKLCWLDPNDRNHPLVRGPAAACPFLNVTGRRATYMIMNGKVLHGLPTNGTWGCP